MKILMLSKFAPTQGGEATKSYWIARGLAQRGHVVNVVTNARETDPAFLVPDALDPAPHLPPAAHLHHIDPEVEFHVPYHLAFAERLASKAIEVTERYGTDVVDSAHLTPFGVAALILKACTGVAMSQRHGGSDVGYLWKSSAFRPLITKVIQAADRMIINTELAEDFLRTGIPAARLGAFRYFIDTTVFRPDGPTDPRFVGDVPTILFSGKITPGKRLIPLVEALADLRDVGFRLAVLPVAFRPAVVTELLDRHGLADRCLVLPPQPCWQMPAILRTVDAVACLETRFTTPNHWPLFPREAMASGSTLLLGREQCDRGAMGLAREGEHFIGVDPDDPERFREQLRTVLTDAVLRKAVSARGAELIQRTERYDTMLDELEQIFEQAIVHCRAGAS